MADGVQSGKIVVMHYVLKEGEALLESTRSGAPVAYLHGKGSLAPGLEAALDGRAAGERFEVTLAPEQAFGVRKGKGAVAVPRREFPKKVDLRPGMPLSIKDSAGQPVQVWVTKIQGAQVWIDVDHPFAGRELTFDVEVVAVRDPTSEELAHGHAHGTDGHHQH